MQTSRFVRSFIALSLAALVLAFGASPAAAQAERPTMEVTFGPTPDPAEAGDVQVDPLQGPFVLAVGQGTPSAYDPGCSQPGGNAGAQPLVVWISDPTFDNPFTPVGGFNVTFNIIAGTNPAGPVSTGPVTMSLELQADGAHPMGSAETTVAVSDPSGGQVPAPLPVGVLNSTATFTFDYSEVHTIPSGGIRVVASLTVSCPQGDWQLQSGPIGPLEYVVGAPTDPDADGDGLPNALDDDDDNDQVSDANETLIGTSPTDAGSTPTTESTNCPGYTFQEVYDETGDPTDCPVEESFPILLILLIILGVILLLGLAGGVVLLANRKIKMTVSHDGFQAIEKGQSAEYELTLIATGKKEELVPVELSLKGVPEDWSAVLEPSHLSLMAGETAEAQTAVLRLIPPPTEEYESEAQVTVTATPTDEEGKTSATKPGTSVKTKTIVNIGVTPPEGERKKKPKKEKKPKEEAPEEPAQAEEGDQKPKKKFGAGMLKRKKKDEEEPEAAPSPEPQAEAAAAAAVPATPAAAAVPPAESKPQIAMGKMVHDPADFSAGDKVTTTVTVRNKGDAPVSGLRLSLYVNDERADQQEVDIPPGESTEVRFQWTAQPDENRVRIKGGLKGA